MTDGRVLTRTWLAVCVALVCSCNVVSSELEADVSEPVAERPAGSDLESLGPGDETRIYYQFVDEKRRVRFVERLADVPEQWRDQAGFVEMSSPPPLSPADARRARNDRYGGPAVAIAGSPTVLLYSAEWCGYCTKARRHLEKRRIPYELRDVDVPAAAEELFAKTGRKGIPVMDIDGRIMRGYGADKYDEMLDQAGFH
jgi:glutaredoxin